MAHKLFAHLRRQWMGALALFLVLTGGSAYALAGHNTVFSDDIVNGEVKQADLTAAEKWHEVGGAGEPTFNADGAPLCSWANFDSNHDSAAFYRDPYGLVHLKGLVKVTMAIGDNGDCWYASGVNDGSFQTANRRIFTLPAGYRPTKRLTDIALSNGHLARIDVDGPGLSGQPAGSVSVDLPTDQQDVKSYLSLNGISFRCAPSRQNGCP